MPLATAWRNVANVCVSIFKVVDAVHQCRRRRCHQRPEFPAMVRTLPMSSRGWGPDARRRRCWISPTGPVWGRVTIRAH